jgi:hypothetical protein
MTTTYTITLTDVQAKALAWAAYDPQDWIQNVANVRAQYAIDEIAEGEIKRMMADPNTKSIPADKEEIVLAADIKSAREAHDAVVAQADADIAARSQQ